MNTVYWASGTLFTASAVSLKSYFVYLPETLGDSPWGCSVTSVGNTRVLPGGDYPPERHPDDHHFTWARGRILQAHQIILITEGKGEAEFGRERKKTQINTGDLFILFPGVWHRYAPRPETGWVEHWIELRGPAVERAMARLGHRQKPIIHAARNPEIASCFERCHGWARHDALQHQALLSTLGLHLVALVLHMQARRERSKEPSISDVVKRAQLLIMERYHQPLNVEALADEIGVGYSHFRKAFAAEIGLSPKQFHLHLRLKKAQDFLANTEKPVKQIAELLGFNSQFHLSSQFKQAIGKSPTDWRKAVGHP